MKKLMSIAALVLSATAAMADPVVGRWQTQPDAGAFAIIRMSTCGAKICGVIESAYNESGQRIQSDNVGKRMVWDMTPQGGGAYRNGKILQPSTGKVYNSKMDLNGNTLRVRGCVGPFCKSQTWARR